jgi:DNA-binding transcriptional LysR family regulator
LYRRTLLVAGERTAVDRIDAMKVFITAIDEGSLVGASRKLGRSPAAVSRAVTFLEARVGVQLLHRTTRSIKLSAAGEPYAIACRRVLADLLAADMQAACEKSVPRGTLSVTAPVVVGEDVLRPILDAFMMAYPTVTVHLHLSDAPVQLIDEGIDAAVRIAHLADSPLIALPVGEVRRVVVASARYLATHPRIREPADLSKHRIIVMPHFGLESWNFPPLPGSSIPRSVHFTPRMVVNSVRGAIDSAIEDNGVTRLYSYQVADKVRDGTLKVVLADHEHAPIPAHLVMPYGRLAVPKVRAFADLAVPRLRAHFARIRAACSARSAKAEVPREEALRE